MYDFSNYRSPSSKVVTYLDKAIHSCRALWTSSGASGVRNGLNQLASIETSTPGGLEVYILCIYSSESFLVNGMARRFWNWLSCLPWKIIASEPKNGPLYGNCFWTDW